MHILLFGKNGQLGWELQRSLTPLGKLTALSHDSKDYCGDFLNPQGLIETINTLKPDVIVNATGYTAVDLAEKEQNIAMKINSESVEVLAKEANKLGSLLVHYSTDYVFDGSGEQPWHEADNPSPVNFYGKTKLSGEQAVQKHCGRHIIFRSSWIYSTHGDNFINTILRLGLERETISIVNDQFGAPTGADLLADCTAHTIKLVLEDISKCGLYHVAASGVTSWYEYALFIFDFAKKKNKKILLKEIRAVPSASFVREAIRPMNSRFNTEKFQREFNLVLPEWKIGVGRMLTELMAK
ncbi:dTDP-4-dehydrorhamnose reductase [Aeromonas sp. FDAARGOS 1415]|uniref:dTDP-4-dehydrorhamnose reductase n=1 Tax=Aeromonas TaxID=642 RepID=UPI001C23D9E6|nr:dTDP-4-dehydrorhamnose reductase [Aeromonas sp. FDAARGOS 1415]QXB54708.1 dTDP-4-dehydrorhamnose reductase [Aeromonas sp. FDAARGOS 1415]